MKRISIPFFALLLAAAGLSMQQAQAHAHLKSQYPAAGADVTAAPQALTLNFSEGIEPGFSGLTLTGPGNTAIATGQLKTDPANPAQVVVPIKQPLTPGSYQVQWHALSVDGHKTQGDYRFNVK